MIYEPESWVLIALALILAPILYGLARARALFAIAALLACLMVVVALMLAALDAPDLALLQAVVGVALLAPLFLGAASLAAKAAAAPRAVRWVAPAGAAIIVALLCFAAPDLPELGGKSLSAGGAIYVNRAVGESGMLNAVAAISANYRAIDSLLAAGAVFLAALGAYAVLGFGERSVLRRPAPEVEPPGEGS